MDREKKVVGFDESIRAIRFIKSYDLNCSIQGLD